MSPVVSSTTALILAGSSAFAPPKLGDKITLGHPFQRFYNLFEVPQSERFRQKYLKAFNICRCSYK